MKLPKRMFKDRPLPAVSLPNPSGFPLGGDVHRHPRPYEPGAFADDRILASDDAQPPSVLLSSGPPFDIGIDVRKHVIKCPAARFVEMETDHCLRGLESWGFRVDRQKGASAIDMVRCLQATHAMDEEMESVMFIDSDMKFDPADAIKLILSNEPVIAGAYAAKVLGRGHMNVAYEDGTTSVRYGMDKDGTPYGGIYPVRSVGAGFLRIKTSLLREMAGKLSLPLCRMGSFKGYPFFMPFVADDERDEEGLPYYKCEDYAFCRRCRDIGVIPKVDTTIRLYHIGDFPYSWEEAAGQYVPRYRNWTYGESP